MNRIMNLLMAVALVASTVFLGGCATRQSPQAKAQTGSNAFRDFNLGAIPSVTASDPVVMMVLTNGDYSVADKAALIAALRPSATMTVGDIYLLDQVMSADAGDGETMTQSPTFTPTTTTDIKGEYSPLGGGGSAADAAVQAGRAALDQLQDKPGSAAACPDGICAPPT